MRRLILIGLFVAAAFLLPIERTRVGAQNACGPSDTSSTNYQDNCGDINWELKATMRMGDGIEYDEGPFMTYGTCYDSTDCNGHHYPGVQESSKYLHDLNDEYEFEYFADEFYWTLYNWTVTYVNDRCSNGYKNAVTRRRRRFRRSRRYDRCSNGYKNAVTAVPMYDSYDTDTFLGDCG